jgi:hypothetical protein
MMITMLPAAVVVPATTMGAVAWMMAMPFVSASAMTRSNDSPDHVRAALGSAAARS